MKTLKTLSVTAVLIIFTINIHCECCKGCRTRTSGDNESTNSTTPIKTKNPDDKKTKVITPPKVSDSQEGKASTNIIKIEVEDTNLNNKSPEDLSRITINSENHKILSTTQQNLISSDNKSNESPSKITIQNNKSNDKSHKILSTTQQNLISLGNENNESPSKITIQNNKSNDKSHKFLSTTQQNFISLDNKNNKFPSKITKKQEGPNVKQNQIDKIKNKNILNKKNIENETKTPIKDNNTEKKVQEKLNKITITNKNPKNPTIKISSNNPKSGNTNDSSTIIKPNAQDKKNAESFDDFSINNTKTTFGNLMKAGEKSCNKLRKLIIDNIEDNKNDFNINYGIKNGKYSDKNLFAPFYLVLKKKSKENYQYKIINKEDEFNKGQEGIVIKIEYKSKEANTNLATANFTVLKLNGN